MKNLLLPLMLLFTACGQSAPPPQTGSADRAPSPVFETQIQAMKKAQAVEGQVMDAAEAQRQQINQAAQ
jgi:hypothetical protein